MTETQSSASKNGVIAKGEKNFLVLILLYILNGHQICSCFYYILPEGKLPQVATYK